MITVFYARVSTVGQSVENQIPDLYRWAQAHGFSAPRDEQWLTTNRGTWTSGGVAWVPEQFTGKTMDRPQWEWVQKQIDDGMVEQVVVWRLDRLGRDAYGLHKVFKQFIENGINLISLKDGVDLSTPAGRMVAGVLASIAQFERESTIERMRAKQSLDADLSRAVHKAFSEGAKVDTIARRLAIKPEIVERIICKPPGVLWYGGRKRGSVTAALPGRVQELLDRGLTPREVAAATGVSLRTIWRRIYDQRSSANK